jgi:ATP-binding cassette, subfamily C, bacterial LapB
LTGYRLYLSSLKRAVGLRKALEETGLGDSRLLKPSPSVIFASVVLNCLALALPLSILQVYDRIVPAKSTETLLALVVILISFACVEGLLSVARSYVFVWHSAQFASATTDNALNRFMNSPFLTTSQGSAQAWNERFDAVTAVADFFGGQSRMLMVDLPFLLLFWAILAVVGGWLALVPVAVLVLYAALAFFEGHNFRDTLLERTSQDNKTFDFLGEAFGSIGIIKALGIEPFMLRRFERLEKNSAKITYRSILSTGDVQSLGAGVSNIMMVAMATIGGILASFDMITVGKLACCTMLSGRMSQPLLRSVSLWHDLQKLSVSLEQIKPLADLPQARRRHGLSYTDQRGQAPTLTLKELRHNTAYGRIVLDEPLSMTIPAGSILAITGPDGCGKSTLLRLLRGDILPLEGSVLIDGKPASIVREKQPWLAGIVTPPPVVFRGTILENLTMFGEGPSLASAREAAQILGVDRDIHKLPDGYDTMIGEGVSDTLPQGLLQRISLARLLACKPSFVLFDEPHVLLDNEADKLLLDAIQSMRGKITVVFTSNRPSYVALADYVIKLGGSATGNRQLAPQQQFGGGA